LLIFLDYFLQIKSVGAYQSQWFPTSWLNSVNIFHQAALFSDSISLCLPQFKLESSPWVLHKTDQFYCIQDLKLMNLVRLLYGAEGL